MEDPKGRPARLVYSDLPLKNQTSKLSSSQLFKYQRRLVAKSRVSTLAIVESFNVFEYHLPSFRMFFVYMFADEFSLETVENLSVTALSWHSHLRFILHSMFKSTSRF